MERVNDGNDGGGWRTWTGPVAP